MNLNKISCIFLLGILICVVSSSHNSSKHIKREQSCRKHCPLGQKWICSTNGTQYRFFMNKCWMDKFNCVEKEEYSHVERRLCQKAHQEHHKSVVASNAHKLDLPNSDAMNKCLKCNAGYKPVCGYNGEINHMFKNNCHLKRFNCIHTEKKFQKTALNNCPIPVINKSRGSRKGNGKIEKDSTAEDKKN
ncbi:U-Kazal-Dg21.2-like [Condylostylus longicornis]|uniref:U-Kazal-Dg21.2-like n=1 Tax=Condylostylus longicornis TaxID=2530218 RepID=UPI00244E1023|nr:U-Kazal-Dg21.2-like [Condylostylus longicornis]